MLAWLLYLLRVLGWALARLTGRLRRPPAWIEFLVERPLPELPSPPGPWWTRFTGGRPGPSLLDLEQAFDRVAAERRVAGVVLHLRPLELSPAAVDAVRARVAALRAAGKRVVAWAPSYTTATYAIACACDEVLLLPSGQVGPLGVGRTHLFFGDALRRVGVETEVFQVSPYKTAFDTFARGDMSPAAREMAGWLADGAFEELVAAVAAGRHLDPQAARALVEGSPYDDARAPAAGAVDGVCTEEDLPARLGSSPVPWASARGRLGRPAPRRPQRVVGLLRVEGTITDGRSGRPPLPLPARVPILLDVRTGDLSLVEQARRLARDRRVGAVVLWIDSGGGSATASVAMTAALRELAARKPLVAAMGSVAASGGYYVATAAARIYARPGTVTGSIGVISAKVTTAGLLERLLVGREQVVRGQAGMEAADVPYTDAQRERVRASIDRTYERFKGAVASGRGMAAEAVEAVAGGRVWTGRQALERGLVDDLGGLQAALVEARRRAGLRPDAPIRTATGGGVRQPPAGPAAALAYALEGTLAFGWGGAWMLSPLVGEEPG